VRGFFALVLEGLGADHGPKQTQVT